LDDADFTDYIEDLDRVPTYNDAKHASLYVGFADDGGLLTPSSLFDRPGAEALLRLAKQRLAVFDVPVPETGEQLRHYLDEYGSFARVLYTEGLDGPRKKFAPEELD
jgi:hypothetical protein